MGNVYITFDGATNGQRIGLQDGTAYFIGASEIIESAKEWIANYERNPLSLALESMIGPRG